MLCRLQATPPSTLRRCALAVFLLACLALSGCQEVDPLEAIRQQQAVGDFEGSTEPLRELLATHPDDPEMNYLYGRALALTGKAGLAPWSLRKAMEDPEWLVAAGSQLAYLELAGSDFNEVYAITGRILEREPENVPALLMRANARAHSKRDSELALADANRVLELSPETVEAYEPRILALLDLERFEEAKDSLAEAGRRLEELGAAEGVLAWHCSTTATFDELGGDLAKARETWARCLEAYPTDLEVVSSAMRFFDAQGEPNRSLEIVRTAYTAVPVARVFRVALAERLRLAGDAAAAEAVLREATSSEDPLLALLGWMDLAKFRQGLGEQGAAVDAMERALELARQEGSPDPELLFEYADALVLAGQLTRALEVAEDLPVPAHSHLIRARVAQERRDPARALQEFDEALRTWPDNPWARYHTALAAEELGDFERALAEFRYAVRIEPGATDARTRGAALLAATGQPGLALQMLVVATDEAPLELEGQLLFVRLSALAGDMTSVHDSLVTFERVWPALAGRVLAAAAEGVAVRAGPGGALVTLSDLPGLDYGDPRFAPALRAMVQFAHAAGQIEPAQAVLLAALTARPDSGAFQEIRGFDLELSGAPAEAVRAAYTRALELEPGNAPALAGLGRLALADDPAAALEFFDRAAAAEPSDPDLKLAAARALVASGKPDAAAERLDALLLAHPFEAEAAAERVGLDLERGVATPRTLERARRAVRCGGGADALELLSRVHAQRDEPESAARAAERARALREAQASEG